MKGKVTGNQGAVIYEVKTEGRNVVRHVNQMIRSTPEIHPVVDLNNRFVHPIITVLPQSVTEISNKSNVEDSKSKSDVKILNL